MSARPSLPRRVLDRVPSFVGLLVAWVVVSGSYTTASFVGGAVVVTLLLVLFPHQHRDGHGHRVRPLWLLAYAGYFLRELAVANVLVARAVIWPRTVEHSRGIVEIPLPQSSRLVTAILANAVSLTPGTSIIEVSEQPPVFHVHVLELQSVDHVRSSIAELHWRIVRAVGPAERLDEVRAAADELRRCVREGAES